MRGFYKLIFFTLVLGIAPIVDAFAAFPLRCLGNLCSAGQYCDSDNGECMDCSDLGTGTDRAYWSDSLTGAEGANGCFAVCYRDHKEDLSNGEFLENWTNNSALETLSYYPQKCAPTCDDANGCNFRCTSGHMEQNGTQWSCEPDIRQGCVSANAAASAKTIQFWEDGVWTPCYATSCANGYDLVEAKNYVDYGTYGICSNKIECKIKDELQVCESMGSETNISGDAVYQNGAWDYSNCNCEYTKSITNGTVQTSCRYVKDGSMLQTSSCKRTITCNTDSCQENGNCIEIQRGYYRNDRSMCTKCPGQKSTKAEDTHATSVSQCGYFAGQTITFKDAKGGKFTLTLGKDIEGSIF